MVLENFVLQWAARRERHAEKMHFLGEKNRHMDTHVLLHTYLAHMAPSRPL